MSGSKWLPRALPVFLIWVAAPMPLWIMGIMLLIF